MDIAKIVEPVLRPNKINAAKEIDTVVLDPGHGGDDSGTSGPWGNEKTFALDVALTAREATPPGRIQSGNDPLDGQGRFARRPGRIRQSISQRGFHQHPLQLLQRRLRSRKLRPGAGRRALECLDRKSSRLRQHRVVSGQCAGCGQHRACRSRPRFDLVEGFCLRSRSAPRAFSRPARRENPGGPGGGRFPERSGGRGADRDRVVSAKARAGHGGSGHELQSGG